MDAKQQLSFLAEVFTSIAERENLSVPHDFLYMSLQAMKQLQANGRSNMLYGFAVGLGRKKKKMAVILFPSKKVITGLSTVSTSMQNFPKM